MSACGQHPAIRNPYYFVGECLCAQEISVHRLQNYLASEH